MGKRNEIFIVWLIEDKIEEDRRKWEEKRRGEERRYLTGQKKKEVINADKEGVKGQLKRERKKKGNEGRGQEEGKERRKIKILSWVEKGREEKERKGE